MARTAQMELLVEDAQFLLELLEEARGEPEGLDREETLAMASRTVRRIARCMEFRAVKKSMDFRAGQEDTHAPSH